MREGSAFKRALAALPEGAKLRLRGPRGQMTLHEDATRAAVFIAGGIGITPFMSMLRQAAHDALPRPLRLLYSNRRRPDAAFLDELESMKHVRLTARMTDVEGFIDEATVKRCVGDAAAPVHYLCDGRRS
jgi:ferredoxin-NADP reductase